LTDLVVNPKDGALYFAIGGRQTQSGLYRVTYAGKESTEPLKDEDRPNAGRDLRRKVEAFHGRKGPRAVETAWPHLDSPDRFVRSAARGATEPQAPGTGRERALAEERPTAAINALLALVRATGQDPFHHPRKPGDPVPGAALKGPTLEALGRIDWGRLDDE